MLPYPAQNLHMIMAKKFTITNNKAYSKRGGLMSCSSLCIEAVLELDENLSISFLSFYFLLS